MGSAPIVIRDQTILWWEALGLRGADVEVTLRPRTADVGSGTKPLERFERSVPDVVCHGRILETNVAWNRDSILWYSSSIGLEEDLCAANVELWVRRGLICLVQGKKCRSNQIVSTFEIVRDRNGQMAIVGNQLLGTPLLSIIIVAVDTEPPISNSLIFDGGVDLLHIDFACPLVALVNGTTLRSVGPKAILKGHLGPCVDTTNPSHAILTVDTYNPSALSTHTARVFDGGPKFGEYAEGRWKVT